MSESLEEERLRIQRQIEQLERTLSGAHNDAALSLDSSTDDEEEDDDRDDDEVEEEPVNDAVSLSEQRLQVQREIEQLENALGQDGVILSDEDDDSDESGSGSGSELDLPENTESCLQMNMVYQQILQEKLQQIETLLRDNKLQQREVEAQLSGQRVASTSQQPRSSSQPAKLFMGRFLKPYFKDKLTGLGPPANPESKEKARNMTLYLDSKRMKLKRWEGWQKTLLIHAVAEDRMRRLIKPKLNKIDYLTQKLSSSQKVDTKNVSEQEDIQQQIDQLEKDILALKVQNEEELVGDRYDNHDWEKISNIDFEGTREAQDICRFWENVLHPSINKTRWSQEEIDRLEEISKEHHERDWEKIAQELGTNRTAFMCLQMYQRYISKTFKNNYWTEEEDQALIELVEKMRMGNFIPYTQMSYFMEGREPVQLLYRWNGVLDPSIRKGPWIPEEDELLLKAVSRFGEKNWWRIRMEVPGRTDGACRDRYYDCLKPGTKRGPFDENERRLLLMLVQKHGVGRWSKIAAEIPNRIDCQCMREWRKYSGQGPVVKKGRKKRGPLNNEASQEAATTTTRQRRPRTAPATRRKPQAANEAGQQAAPAPRRRRQAAKTTGKRRRKRIKRESDDDEDEISVEESGDETQLVYMDTDTDEEDKKAVIRKVKQRRRGEEVETQEREGGGEVQVEESQGGELVQIEESLGAEEVQIEDRQGGEEVQIDQRQGREGLETQERGGGDEAQTEERRGMEVLTEDKRGVEKAVQTEARPGVEKEVTEVQAVQKVKKEHPLPPMEEWIPRTRVGKCDALKGCLVSRPEPCSSSDHTTSDGPTAVRSTIVNRCGFLVESLLGQAPKPLPRWRRHQPTALIQLSRTQLNSLMQRKASSVANRGADWVMQFRLMAAVTPWIGNLLLPTPWTRRSAADHLRERAEGRHLSSTSVFLLLLRTLHVDLAGCKTAIEEMTGGKKSASPAGSFCVSTPSLKREPKLQVQELVVQQQPTLLQRHQQQHVKYLLQQQRQQQQLVHQVQAHTSQQQEVTRQPCPQSLQPHHLQPKTSNTPPPWMIPPQMPPHVLMPIPPNMLQYLPLMRPGMCTKLPPLPFPFRSVPQTRQQLAVSMSSATTVSMSPSTPVSVSPSTPVSKSSSTPVTMSHTPVTPSSNASVSMPTPTAVQAVPLPHDPSAVPLSLPNSSVSRASAAATIPGQPSVPSETTSHASSPAEEKPGGRKRQRKLTEKVKLLQEDAAAKVEAKEKKMVTPKKQARKKQKIGPDFMPPGQTLWKMTVDGLVQVVSGEDVPPGLKLPLPAISGRSTPARNISFQQRMPSPNSSTNKTQTPHSHAPPTSVPPQCASSPFPGGIHPGMLKFLMVPPPPGPSAGSSSQPQRQAAPTSPYAIRPVFHNVQICPPVCASPGPLGSPFQPRPPPPSVQPPATSASSSSPLPVGNHPAFHDSHVRPPTGAPRGPPPGPSPAPTGSTFQPRPPPLRQPHTPARPLSFCLLRPGSHPLPRFPSPPVSAVRTPFKGTVNAAPRTPPVGSRPVFQGHHVRPATGPPRGPPSGPSPVPSTTSFQPRLPPLPRPHPPASLTLFRPGSPLPRFPGPVRGTVDATPRTPPRLKIELSQLDPSLMFAEPGAEVERWMSGYGGVTVPGSNVALPYLPPFISNLRTLCALLKAKRLLVDKALHVLPQSRPVGSPRPGPRPGPSPGPSPATRPGPSPATRPGPSPATRPGPSPATTPGPSPATTPGPFPDHDYIQTTQLAPEGDERVAAVRHLVAQRFAANPAYQLLKARFLSCFTVPALLATIQPIIDLPDSCTANEEESSSEEEEELRVGGANDELRGGEEEELRGGEAEEELRDGEEENGHSQNPLLLMQGAPATHYSGMTTRRTSRLQATEPPQTTSRLQATEPPQTTSRLLATEPPQTTSIQTAGY